MLLTAAILKLSSTEPVLIKNIIPYGERIIRVTSNFNIHKICLLRMFQINENLYPRNFLALRYVHVHICIAFNTA